MDGLIDGREHEMNSIRYDSERHSPFALSMAHHCFSFFALYTYRQVFLLQILAVTNGYMIMKLSRPFNSTFHRL